MFRGSQLHCPRTDRRPTNRFRVYQCTCRTASQCLHVQRQSPTGCSPQLVAAVTDGAFTDRTKTLIDVVKLYLGLVMPSQSVADKVAIDTKYHNKLTLARNAVYFHIPFPYSDFRL